MAVCFLACFAACGDDIQFAPAPPAERAALPAGHPAPESGGAAAEDPFADNAAPAEATAEAATHEETYFSGEVKLAEGMKLPATYTIYLMAGPPPSGRPPLLSRRYDKPSFPFVFSLGSGDIPFKDSKVAGPQVLSVIISEKGPVMATEGLYKRCTMEVQQAPGSKGITLELKY